MARRRSRTLDLAFKQMTEAIDTVVELENAVKAISKGQREEVEKRLERLFLIEVEVDALRRSVLEELTSSGLPPRDREDLINMVKRLDSVADHVKDSARNIQVLIHAAVPSEMWNAYVEMAKDTVECAKALHRCLEKLGDAPTEARELTKRVDEMEGKVDEDYLRTKTLFLKYSREVDTAVLLFLKDLLEAMEHIADTCDDTADYVRILTAPA